MRNVRNAIRNTDYSRQEIGISYSKIKKSALAKRLVVWAATWIAEGRYSARFILVLFGAEPNEKNGIWTVKAS